MGYFPNLVLMGVFIGMGLGFLFHQHISEEKSAVLLFLSTFVLGSLVIFLYYKHLITCAFYAHRQDTQLLSDRNYQGPIEVR